jgi:hypothetical protein
MIRSMRDIISRSRISPWRELLTLVFYVAATQFDTVGSDGTSFWVRVAYPVGLRLVLIAFAARECIRYVRSGLNGLRMKGWIWILAGSIGMLDSYVPMLQVFKRDLPILDRIIFHESRPFYLFSDRPGSFPHGAVNSVVWMLVVAFLFQNVVLIARLIVHARERVRTRFLPEETPAKFAISIPFMIGRDDDAEDAACAIIDLVRRRARFHPTQAGWETRRLVVRMLPSLVEERIRNRHLRRLWSAVFRIPRR